MLLRHGESTWNQENLFTGWHDVPLSTRGETEAAAAGETLLAEGLAFDKAHTSVLLRAIQTANLALADLGQLWLPVERSWRLNERHYGALQGLDKKQTAEQYGPEQVKLWRRSYDVPPPPVEADSPEHPGDDPRYRRLPPDVLPAPNAWRTSWHACCRTGTTRSCPTCARGYACWSPPTATACGRS